MILTFRAIKERPPEWKPVHARRPAAPFGATYERTLVDLDRELRHLGGTDPYLQVELGAGDDDVRLDGQLRAHARPAHPGVLLTFDTKAHGILVYGTDAFDHWHGNLRAIALGLDALRRVERYGIAERGQQYAGYRELPPGSIELGRGMTVEEASRLLCEAGAHPDPLVAYRLAVRAAHPDVGGDPDVFRRLTEARDLVAGAR